MGNIPLGRRGAQDHRNGLKTRGVAFRPKRCVLGPSLIRAALPTTLPPLPDSRVSPATREETADGRGARYPEESDGAADAGHDN